MILSNRRTNLSYLRVGLFGETNRGSFLLPFEFMTMRGIFGEDVQNRYYNLKFIYLFT